MLNPMTKEPTLDFKYSGMRRDNMDNNDDRVRDLPPRGHQGGGGQGGPSSYNRQGGGQGGPRNPQRRDRRDDRRRTTDDEDTVLDSQDVSSVDRGKKAVRIFYFVALRQTNKQTLVTI